MSARTCPDDLTWLNLTTRSLTDTLAYGFFYVSKCCQTSVSLSRETRTEQVLSLFQKSWSLPMSKTVTHLQNYLLNLAAKLNVL